MTENPNTYKFLGTKEGMLFFTEHNDSTSQQLAFRNLEDDDEGLEVDSDGWKVKKEKSMTFQYWLTVWLVPALLLGIHELR